MALTGGEFDLLSVFVDASRPRACRATSCWSTPAGARPRPFDRTIDVQVGRLRKKLEADVDDPQIIKSVRGAGYILVPAGERAALTSMDATESSRRHAARERRG